MSADKTFDFKLIHLHDAAWASHSLALLVSSKEHQLKAWQEGSRLAFTSNLYEIFENVGVRIGLDRPISELLMRLKQEVQECHQAQTGQE